MIAFEWVLIGVTWNYYAKDNIIMCEIYNNNK